MAEIAPAGGGPNRLFVMLAIGLAALLVLGLVGLGGYFVIQNMFKPAPQARVVATATVTRAPTSAPTPMVEAATPTLVLSGSPAATQAVVLLATESAKSTPTANSGQLPQSGLGEDLLLLTGGVVLVVIIFLARRMRTA